jgi:ribonuclease HII
MLICGIDEAGRGPVIGPLVICGILVDESGEESLKSVNVKDSKLLTPKQREVLFGKIKKIVKKYEILILQPHEIDMVVDGHVEDNLNWFEARESAEIIKKLKPDKAILDCPSPNLKAYREKISELLKDKTEIVCEHKADVKYPVVSAASILAKVTRDAEIKKLEKKYGKIGSGYPADPLTHKFLQENFNRHPEIFRHSWTTMKKLKKAAGQRGLGEF